MKNDFAIQPTTENLLVAFVDLKGFVKLAKKMSEFELFNFLNQFYELVGEIIEANDGTVIKFMGDSALITFSNQNVSIGIMSLIKLKEQFESSNFSCGSKLIVKVHYGPVIVGLMGTKDNKRHDIIGETVNIAAQIVSHGFAMSPQAFRCLSPEIRKIFKKHTPAIRYIPVEERHQD